MQGTLVRIGDDLVVQLCLVGHAENKPLPSLVDELLREALENRKDREAWIAELEREHCTF